MVQSLTNHLQPYQIKKQLGNEEVALRNKSKISPISLLGIIICMSLSVSAVGGQTAEGIITACTGYQKSYNTSENIAHGPVREYACEWGTRGGANCSKSKLKAERRNTRFRTELKMYEELLSACAAVTTGSGHEWGLKKCHSQYLKLYRVAPRSTRLTRNTGVGLCN
jgi:hypothetical protein